MTPARAVLTRAEALYAKGDELAIATDASADPVLIGLRTERCSVVLAVDRLEYDGLALATKLFNLRAPTAIEKLRRTTK